MVVDGPTICFFKSLDNNMVNTLGIDVYLNIQKSVQNKSLIGFIIWRSWDLRRQKLKSQYSHDFFIF